MKSKHYFIFTVILILSLLLTNTTTYFLTYTHFLNIAVPIETVQLSSDPNFMFSRTQAYCQPNKMNGSCSKLADGSYTLITNKWSSYHQEQMEAFKNYAVGVVNSGLRSLPLNNSMHYANTVCRNDIAGNLICNSVGN